MYFMTTGRTMVEDHIVQFELCGETDSDIWVVEQFSFDGKWDDDGETAVSIPSKLIQSADWDIVNWLIMYQIRMDAELKSLHKDIDFLAKLMCLTLPSKKG